jgi:hypothetical protein
MAIKATKHSVHLLVMKEEIGTFLNELKEMSEPIATQIIWMQNRAGNKDSTKT